jgi:hypothetical protein
MKTFDGTVGCWRHHNTAAIYNAPYGPNDNFDLLSSNVLLGPATGDIRYHDIKYGRRLWLSWWFETSTTI